MISTYEDVASEYYDSARHPTCANFSELSLRFLNPRIVNLVLEDINVLEVGVGRSSVAPVMSRYDLPLAKLTLLDESAKMLEYSRNWSERGAVLVVGDACHTGLASEQFELVVSSLGDPYNTPSFWREVARLLMPDGHCLFTMPSHEWAGRFRKLRDQTLAEMVLSSGETIVVPSNIPPMHDQMMMIREAGLQVIEVEHQLVDALVSERSPKLMITEETMHFPIVNGFTLQKRNGGS